MAAAAPGNAERQRDLSLSAAKLAILQRERGDLDAAESSLRHALAISERAYGPDHPDAAGALAAKLKESAPAIGLDIGRLTDVETRLRTVTVTQGIGVRINEAQGGRLQVIGVAVGGSVSGSTFNIGIPPGQLEGLVRPYRELSETQKKLIAELEAKLVLNQRQVCAALEILGEKGIPPERLAAKLVEIAGRFKALQAEALVQLGDDAKTAALKAEAQKAIEAGDLAKADALLADVESEQRRMRDRLAVNLAETSGRR